MESATTPTVGEFPETESSAASHTPTPISHRRRALSHGSSLARRGGGADHRAREFCQVAELVKARHKPGRIIGARDAGLARIRFRKPVG